LVCLDEDINSHKRGHSCSRFLTRALTPTTSFDFTLKCWSAESAVKSVNENFGIEKSRTEQTKIFDGGVLSYYSPQRHGKDARRQ
jgi:hypothetical protein